MVSRMVRCDASHYNTNGQIDEDEKYARSKFGNQKGISSDEFFGRAAFDPTAQTEAKSRLQGFEGATSISSNAYFGRPEDDTQPDEYGNYGDLEGAARDLVRKFGVTAGDDLENLTQVLGEGASKLQGQLFCSHSSARSESHFVLRVTLGAIRSYLSS